ncbi:MAG TPA: DegT/DnrJ/EryC1/StrS family aminotransferase, partial [Vicinamibacterales bacterium]|nr:DegT/DnrJ/EryC1/StrS family aminotransferase [Vicinamibacterales bacterium]
MQTKVPLLDLHAQYAPIRDEILAAMTRVADSQRFIMGPEIDALERELAAKLGARHAIAVSSGTDALLLALMALGIGPGDEVVTSDYSFFATAGAVVRIGATPVFVDIDPATFNVDAAAVARAVTPRTKAIIPVHLFGLAADLDPLLELAKARRIAVIEDAAQAIGAAYRGKIVGTLGAFGCFSFFPSKNLGAFGDAGLLTTNDADFDERARLLRTHGMKPRYVHHAIGGNFRMDALQAAVLRVKLPYLDRWTEGRRANASRYAALFERAGLADRVRLPVEPAEMRHIYNQFVIRTRDRDALRRHLDERGIGTEVYYPVPFHRQPCFAGPGDAARAFPRSDEAAATSLAIPIYAELTEAQQSSVVESIAEYLNR